MLKLIFALFMAFACPAHNNNTQGTGTVITASHGDDGDPTGGDGGYVPPVPPPHKH